MACVSVYACARVSTRKCMRLRVYDVCVYESVNLGGADTYVQMHKCSCARDTFI